MKQQLDLYSLGEVVIDFIPGAEPNSYIRNAGGAPANVAIAMVRNGFRAGVCCSVGEDDFGSFLIETMKKNGVEVLRKTRCAEAVTTLAFVTLDTHGDRSFTFARKPGADMFLSEEDITEEDLDRSIIIHAGSCSLSAQPAANATVSALRRGHEKGKLVSFDINYRNLMWNDDIDACTRAVEGVLPYVDILKISDEEVLMLGGRERLFEQMKKFDIRLIVMTLGADGACAFFQENVLEVSGKKGNCVDTTGAGDAFWGGFLSCLRKNDVRTKEDLTEPVLWDALCYGNISGWLCVQSKGAITSLPTGEEIAKYL